MDNNPAAEQSLETDEDAEEQMDASQPLQPLIDEANLIDPVTRKGQQARGLYYSGPAVQMLGIEGIKRSLLRSQMDAAVIDLKDERGHLTYDTDIEILESQQKIYLEDAPGMIRQLKESGVYVIGRIVCFSDPILPRKHNELAVMDGRRGKEGQLWANWGKRNTWLDPYNRRNHDIIVALAKEAASLGIDEIQLDYIRFPVDKAANFAVFPAKDDNSRAQVLLELLRRIDIAIRIPIGVDVFGLTAFRWWKASTEGLGQEIELWKEYVEVFTPMLYIYGMRSWMRDNKGRRAQRLVRLGVSNLRRRLGPVPIVRPFLQAFDRGIDEYNTEFIAEQIQGAKSGGSDGFLFWHPGSNYRLVRECMRELKTPKVFPIDERLVWRQKSWQQESHNSEDN